MATSDLPFPTSQTATNGGSTGGSGSKPSAGSSASSTPSTASGSSGSSGSLSGGSLSGSAMTGSSSGGSGTLPGTSSASSGGARPGSASGAGGSASHGDASMSGSRPSDGSGSEGSAYRSMPSSSHGGLDDSTDDLDSALSGGSGAGSRDRSGHDMLSRVVQGAHHTIDRLAESVAPHVQKLQQGVSQTGSRLSSRADDARDVGDEWAESLRCTVRENPLAAVATAVAVGVLLSRISR